MEGGIIDGEGTDTGLDYWNGLLDWYFFVFISFFTFQGTELYHVNVFVKMYPSEMPTVGTFSTKASYSVHTTFYSMPSFKAECVLC